MKFLKNKRSAFTLVELIVVITILAILGTIAFINLQGYSTGARDSKRLSDINNLQKKIALETSKGTSLLSLVNTVKTNSGLTINNGSGTSIQGTANFVNLKENGASFKDPITGGDYILAYSVGGSGTGAYKFTQISTVNEENNQAVVKGNYYQIQPSDSPSIIKNDSDLFVIDEGTELPYEVTNEVVEISPYASCMNAGEILTGTTTYTGCDTPDIILCSGASTGYTISACNIGATIASTDWTISRGEYFQWGRNKAFSYGDTSQQSTSIDGSIGLNAGTDTYGFVWSGSLAYPWNWATTDISNNWGDTTNTNIARQGPCTSGYHVPSQIEWSGTITAGGWGNNGTAMQTALKLPYTGSRHWSNGTFINGGSNGGYLSSTPNNPNAYSLYFFSSYISSTSSNGTAYGLSVRCFKN